MSTECFDAMPTEPGTGDGGTGTRPRRPVSGLLSIPMVLMLAACSVFQTPERTAPTLFLIEDTRPVTTSLSPQAPSLVVDPVTAGSAYDGSDMLYLSGDELQRFARNRWAAPPADMLHSVLLAALERTSSFSSVLAGPNSARPDLVLETELISLRQEFSGDTSTVRLRIRAQLVDRASGEPLMARGFEATEAADGDPASGAAAANRAALRLAAEIAEAVAAAARKE